MAAAAGGRDGAGEGGPVRSRLGLGYRYRQVLAEGGNFERELG